MLPALFPVRHIFYPVNVVYRKRPCLSATIFASLGVEPLDNLAATQFPLHRLWMHIHARCSERWLCEVFDAKNAKDVGTPILYHS